MKSAQPFIVALTLCAVTTLSSTTALAVDGVRWPSPTNTTSADPVAAVRWPWGGWTCALSRQTGLARTAQSTLNTLDQHMTQHPNDARTVALRAIPLRLLERFDEARQTIDRARALDANSVDDPDVQLTHAFLLARAGSYEAAVHAAQGILPRLVGPLDKRIEATLEVARWSLLRGTAGTADALGLLRGAAAVQPSPVDSLRAALAFALLLDQKVDEARFVARSGAIPLLNPTSHQAVRPSTGTLAPYLVDAAAASAMAYTASAYDCVTAVEALSQSLQISTEVRRVLTDALAVARTVVRPREPTVASPLFRARSSATWDD